MALEAPNINALPFDRIPLYKRPFAWLLARSRLARELGQSQLGGMEVEERDNHRGLINIHRAGRGRYLSNLAGSVTQAGMGAGLISGYFPWVRSAMGYGTVSHGTSAENLQNILEGGLDLAHAGKADRLNSKMMMNAAIDLIEEKTGKKMPPRMFRRLTEHMEGLQDLPVEQRHFANRLINYTEDQLQALGVPMSKEDIGRAFTSRGRRIYFGGSPHHVVEWGGVGSEGQLALNRALPQVPTTKAQAAKRAIIKPLATVADILSGGVVSLGEEAVHAARFSRGLKGVPTMNLTRADTLKWLAEHPELLAGNKAVLGVGTGHLQGMGAFKDFPVVGPAVGLNKGIQRLISGFLPNYTPGRDLSIGHSVDPSAFQRVHLMDKNNKIRRIINLTDAARVPASGQVALRSRLGAAAKPAAVTALGAHLLVRGLTGKGLYGHGKDLVNWYRGTGKEQNEPMAKTAALSAGLRRGLSGATTFGGIAGVVSIPSLLGGLAPADSAEEATGAHAGILGGGAATAAGGTALTVRQVGGTDALQKLLTQGGLGYMSGPHIAGGSAVGAAELSRGVAARSHASAAGRDAFLLGGMLTDDQDRWIRRNPWIGPVADAAALTGTGALAGYAMKRYYPSFWYGGAGRANASLDMLAGDPLMGWTRANEALSKDMIRKGKRIQAAGNLDDVAQTVDLFEKRIRPMLRERIQEARENRSELRRLKALRAAQGASSGVKDLDIEILKDDIASKRKLVRKNLAEHREQLAKMPDLEPWELKYGKEQLHKARVTHAQLRARTAAQKLRARLGPKISLLLPLLVAGGVGYLGMRGGRYLARKIEPETQKYLERERRQKAKEMGVLKEYEAHLAEQNKGKKKEKK